VLRNTHNLNAYNFVALVDESFYQILDENLVGEQSSSDKYYPLKPDCHPLALSRNRYPVRIAQFHPEIVIFSEKMHLLSHLILNRQFHSILFLGVQLI